MWEDLQRQIRSLHVTVRVERQSQVETQRDNTVSNPGPSTSAASSSNESAKNFKKALLENYLTLQRESNEGDRDARSYDQNQPSTSTGLTGLERNRENEPTSSTRNVEESTNISLSNLLPSDTELRRMQCVKLNEMLDGLYARLTSRCQNCDSRVADVQAMNDHTYSSLTSDGDVQLPSMSSVVSNIGANANLPAVTAITTTESEPLPSISSFVSGFDHAGPSRSTQASDTNVNYPATGDVIDNNNRNNDNINSDPLTQYPANQTGTSARLATYISSDLSSDFSNIRHNRLRERREKIRYVYTHTHIFFLLRNSEFYLVTQVKHRFILVTH